VEKAESDMERQNYLGTRKNYARHKMSGDSKGKERKSEEKTQMHSYVVLIISTAWLHDAASCLVMRRAGCRPFWPVLVSVHDFRETLPAILRQQQLVSQVLARPCASILYTSVD